MPQITELKLCVENGCNQVWEMRIERCSCGSTQFFPLNRLNLSTNAAKNKNLPVRTNKIYQLSQSKKECK